MFPFDPLENMRKPKVLCFQGDQKGALGTKALSGLMLRNVLEAPTGAAL